MPALVLDLTIEQGADFARAWGSSAEPPVGVLVNGEVIDNTWTARGQIRTQATSPDVLYDLAPEVDADGFVKIAIPADDSTGWDWRDAVYDIFIHGPGDTPILRVAKGKVTVDPEVTRA